MPLSRARLNQSHLEATMTQCDGILSISTSFSLCMRASASPSVWSITTSPLSVGFEGKFGALHPNDLQANSEYNEIPENYNKGFVTTAVVAVHLQPRDCSSCIICGQDKLFAVISFFLMRSLAETNLARRWFQRPCQCFVLCAAAQGLVLHFRCLLHREVCKEIPLN